MTKEEFTTKVESLKIAKNRYSIEDGMRADSYLLVNNYSILQIYYIDERGGQNLINQFLDEGEAYNCLYELLTEYL